MNANATAKSTRPAKMAAIGISSRGKYTFAIRWLLPTRLLAAELTVFA